MYSNDDDDDDSYQDLIPDSREKLAPESKNIAQTSPLEERSEELIAPNKDEASEISISGKPNVVKIDQSKLRPKKAVSKLKKAPEAPKRFKSAFIFFSTEKHKEIRARLGERGISEKTANISKLVSEAWRELSPDDRVKWESMARSDRARYEVEKAMFKGPWHVPKGRKQKDANAPKRPMSAFLAFANSRRGTVKQGMPGSSNGDVSRALAAMWKGAPEYVRQSYFDEEQKKRKEYISATAEWKKKDEEEKRIQRQQREEMALRVAEDMETKIGGSFHHDNGTATDSYRDSMAMTYQGMASRYSNYSSSTAFPFHSPYGQGYNYSSSTAFPFHSPYGQGSTAQFTDRRATLHPDESKFGSTSGDMQQPLAALLAQSSSNPDRATAMFPAGSYMVNPYTNPQNDIGNYGSHYQYQVSASAELSLSPNASARLGSFSHDPYSLLSSSENPYHAASADTYSFQYPVGYQYPGQYPLIGYTRSASAGNCTVADANEPTLSEDDDWRQEEYDGKPQSR